MSTGLKLLLFAILAAVCFILGWCNFVWPHETVVEWIHHYGYWMILVSTLVWVFSLIKAYPAIRKKEGYSWLFNRKNFIVIALIIGLWAVLQLGEEKSFKILLDEPVLVNTSRMMHYSREVYVVSNAERVDGILAAKGYVDKRPNFFPFLLCVIHDLTGYRVENAFYLNSALTLILFALTFLVAAQIAGRPAGYLAVGMLASIPLLWHQASGAGFEILNLVMILLTLKVAIDYLNNPTKEKLSALCLTAVMLSQVRYESILFIIPAGIVVMMGWSLAHPLTPSLREGANNRGCAPDPLCAEGAENKSRRDGTQIAPLFKVGQEWILPWGAWLAPILLIPVLWQQRVFSLDPGFWELFSVSGLHHAFSLDYYNSNALQAVFFFFDWIRQIPNAPLVAFIGWIAVLIFVLRMCIQLVAREYREGIIDNDRPTLVYWVFILGFGLYFTLLMCYAFDLGHYMVDRLALPLYLTLALTSGVVWTRWIKGGVMGYLLFLALFVWVSFGWIKIHASPLMIVTYLGGIAVASVAYFFYIKNQPRHYYKILGGIILAGLLGWSIPSAASREYASIYYPMVEGQCVDHFIREHKDERYLVVADMSMLWTTYNLEALPNRAVNCQMPLIKYFLENPNNPPIYVMQSLNYNPVTRRYEDLATEPLTNQAVLSPMKDYTIGSFRIMRMSRLMDLHGVEPIDDSEMYKGDEDERLQDWVGKLP
jgi:hypothetical protein